ncbi:MAG: hypothetical protein K8963_10155, partial [Proteobacteria bacterium]|nr:hypothetical protein [Pseudomonadota bacterium]
ISAKGAHSSARGHTCAINTTGELYCWGRGVSGQLGLDNTFARNTPAQVGTATNWSQISAGASHTCATNATGRLHCWGSNLNGRLGLGNEIGQTTPTPVTTARTPTIAPVLANLTLTGPAGMFGAGNTIPALTYTNTGGDVQPDGCAIDTTSSRPDLPAGLRAHPIVSGTNVTCQISGIPTEAATMATYHLTATNAIGSSETVTVSFQVDLVRPLLADIATEQSYTVGTAITPLTFTNTGLAVATDSCAVSPALPAGLAVAVFDNAGTMTCQIAGNPSAGARKTIYVITATDANGGTDEARITITVPDPLTSPVLADIATEQTYTVGTQITALIFTNSGRQIKNSGCSAIPALPEGLTVDLVSDTGLSSCQITGTPSEVTAKENYSITGIARIGFRTDSATVTITVVAAPGG